MSVRADEIVTTTDGRTLRLGDDGRYEWLTPEPVATLDNAAPTLTVLVTEAQAHLGQRVSLPVTLKLLGGRALASDDAAPGIGLAVGLDRVSDAERTRVVRDCGFEGCRVVLTGTLRRNARGPFLDAETIGEVD